MKTQSIRSRLLTWLTIPLFLVIVLAFVIIFYLLNRNVNQHFDNALLVASKGIEERLYVRDGVLRFNLPYFGIDLQTSSGSGSVFYSVEDENKKLLSGFEDIPKPKTSQRSTFYKTKYTNQEVRALYVEHQMYRNGILYKATIIVAETLEDRKELVRDILWITIGITSLIILIAIGASVFSVKKGIEPLINLKHLIKRRDMHDLTPLKEEAPSEVAPLIKSINKLFMKLKKSFLHVERFNADVSHQLRTPLAELKVLIETDEVLKKSLNKKKYLDIIDGMSYTTEQLLLWTKTNPDAFDRDWFKPINLSKLCEKYAKEKVPFIYKSGFEFVFESEPDLWINGGPIVLEGLLNNLVENAIKYTKGGTITLLVKRIEDKITICIEDEGAGIPKKYLTKIYNRFYRLDSKQTGSGLGLGIVKQIAELHGGLVTIENKKPKGLKVSIVFPPL